jgi:O-antigen ligase
MARLLGTIIWAVFTLLLFWLNREKTRTSAALWIPTFWLFIGTSRNIAEWFNYSGNSQGDRYLEGNPLDRAILSTVIALGIIVLITRGRIVVNLLRANLPILIYFIYCGTSALWSDYPDVSFKRWFRAVGDIVMILIVLSDPDWILALKRLLSRVGILVIPLSVLFIRYFPELGRSYSRGGAPSWTGVATDKNALGMLCLILGLASLYRFLEIYTGKEEFRKRGPLFAQAILFLLTLYLLVQANSATAAACFGLAAGPMVLTYLFSWARKPAMLRFIVIAVIVVPFSSMFLGLGSGLVQDLGRDTTFTGRTAIWHYAIPMVPNSLLGAGFESFWLGHRITDMERLIGQGVNQAHNGYIEVFLNLGYIGVFLLAILLITGFRRILPDVRSQSHAGSLRLAYLIVAVAYNFSEGGFKMMSPVWFLLLLSIAILPKQLAAESPVPKLPVRNAKPVTRVPAKVPAFQRFASQS